jgi:hypothetical protein
MLVSELTKKSEPAKMPKKKAVREQSTKPKAKPNTRGVKKSDKSSSPKKSPYQRKKHL